MPVLLQGLAASYYQGNLRKTAKKERISLRVGREGELGQAGAR